MCDSKWQTNHIKRLFDLAVAIPSIIILSPLLIFIGILVRMKIGSPALFRQTRPGLLGKPFTIYKFRTMTDELDKNGNLLPDGERLTSLGRFLRKTSIDELPEFFNVIKGDMSIIRPTFPQLFGRTTLSPRAFKWHDFIICLATTPCSINGLKFDIAAFPHASQDNEHLTCAETSIWSIMEYFGHKYVDYVPVLPSDIITALSSPAFERVVPSRGLSVSQISFALKQFGFGPRIYSREAFQDRERDFRRILSWYVESGIPVIVALKDNATGHAVLFVGHENITDGLRTGAIYSSANVGSGAVDTGDFDKRYIVVDDNYPPYQVCTFDGPTDYYSDSAFKDLRISAFVVPLYPRIYLEPIEAYSLAMDVFKNLMAVPCDAGQVVTRFFLTSSRSYKNWVVCSTALQKELKKVVLATSMPKFIWIMEISDKELFVDCMAAGMIIIDATGDASRNSLLFFAYAGIMYLRIQGVYKEIETGFADFPCYENNLKGEWSQWKT